ncbi:uncharacterized protein [Lolium perenne]|uniref:uncharacterized protein n=1 Tax=Lolium perenne TaxID=4522 RepID=UPI003A99CAC1
MGMRCQYSSRPRRGKLQTPSLFLPLLSPHSLHAEVASDPTAPARSTGAALPIGGIATPPLLAPSALERRHPPPRPARSNAAAHPTGGIAAAALPTGGIAIVALTHGVLLRTRVNAAGRTQNCLLRNREIAAALLKTDMETKRNEAEREDEQPVSSTHIVAQVLKEHNSSSTFLSTMGYQSRSGRSRTSASEELVRELEEKVEQQKREALDANTMYQQQLIERGETQEAALEEMQRKQQEELAAMKKSQEEKNKAYEKKQEEQDSLISFLLRKHATQN